MVPSLPLLSCESSMSVKENPDRKKTKQNKRQVEKDRQTAQTPKDRMKNKEDQIARDNVSKLMRGELDLIPPKNTK